MNIDDSFQRLTGVLAILAGILALLSLVVGLAGVGYDFEVFSDTSSLIVAGTVAAAWSFLIEQYAIASLAQQEFLVIEFQVVNAIAEEGLHGVIQNLAGAVWFLGMGALLRSTKNSLGIFAMIIGVFLMLNTLGNMFNLEFLSLLGLTANIVLGPLWSIWIGVLFVQLKTNNR